MPSGSYVPCPHLLPARCTVWDLLFASPPRPLPSAYWVSGWSPQTGQAGKTGLVGGGEGWGEHRFLLGYWALRRGGSWATLWDVEVSGVTSRKLSPCLLFESLCRGSASSKKPFLSGPQVERFQQGTVREGQLILSFGFLFQERRDKALYLSPLEAGPQHRSTLYDVHSLISRSVLGCGWSGRSVGLRVRNSVEAVEREADREHGSGEGAGRQQLTTAQNVGAEASERQREKGGPGTEGKKTRA